MASTKSRLLGALFVSGLLGIGLGACSSDSGNGTGSTGGSGGSSSGSVSSAGGGSSSVASSANAGSSGGSKSSSGGQSSSSSSSKGGDVGGSSSSQPASSGGVATGGSSSSEVASSGGSTTSTGTGTGGKGGGTGTGTGGKGGGTGTGTGTGTGGKGGSTSTGVGGTSAAGGTTAAGGSTSAGGCQKGGFKGSDLVIFGESFYDWQPPYIKQRMEENARKAGSLGASDSYRQYAVAGQNMSYIANTEYNNAVKAGKFTKVVMDGGGIDCMQSSCPTCPDTFKGMLDKLVTQGVDQLIYTRYPEPGNPPGSNASLKGNLDALMPKMETVCKGYTGLKCYWVDLRPLWPAEKDKYTTDGLHPTKAGGDAVGDAIWAEMVKQCMAQ